MFNEISKKIYGTQGEVYQAIANLTGDFKWPGHCIYYEQSTHDVVDTPIGKVVIALYRFSSGRYELTAYMAMPK